MKMKVRNTFIVFLVSGFWHGANWTFIFWGLLNAFFILPSIIFNTNRNNLEIVGKGKFLPSLKDLLAICVTFSLTVFAWIFFRAESLIKAFDYIKSIFSYSIIDSPFFPRRLDLIVVGDLLIFFFIIEWIGREGTHALENLGLRWNKRIRLSMYYVLVLLIYYFGGNEQEFIYFQF